MSFARSPWRLTRWERATGRLHKLATERAFRRARICYGVREDGAGTFGFDSTAARAWFDTGMRFAIFAGPDGALPGRSIISTWTRGTPRLASAESGLGRIDDRVRRDAPRFRWYTTVQGFVQQ